MKTVVFVFLLLVAPVLMAPACSSSDATSQPSAEPQMLLCASDGAPLGIGIPGPNWAMFSCDVQLKRLDTGCDCWEFQNGVILAIPPVVLDPEALKTPATVCVEQATFAATGLTENNAIVYPYCTFIGFYLPPDPGSSPNDYSDDNAS